MVSVGVNQALLMWFHFLSRPSTKADFFLDSPLLPTAAGTGNLPSLYICVENRGSPFLDLCGSVLTPRNSPIEKPDVGSTWEPQKALLPFLL